MPAGRYQLIGELELPPHGVRGVTDLFIASALVYVKKAPSARGLPVVANEYICAELARLLRLPVPPSFIVDIEGDPAPSFACLSFNLAGENLPAIQPSIVVKEEPDLCCGVLVFDTWITNTDRHKKNLSFTALRSPHRMNVFDHSHTPFGFEPFAFFSDKLGLEGPVRGIGGNRHCLLDAVTDAAYFHKWLARIESVPDDLIREIVEDAAPLGLTNQQVQEGARFLIDRRLAVRQLIRRNRDQFTTIRDWGLLWQE